MARLESPYYPPRARWYGWIFYVAAAARRAVRMERVHLPGGLSVPQCVGSIVLPGFPFFLLGQRAMGIVSAAGYLITAAVFIVMLGYEAASVCFGLMISIHATGIVYLQSHFLRDHCLFRTRLVLALATLLVVWLLAYLPMLRFVQHRWIMPLRAGGQVFVVLRTANPESLQRGDLAAFRTEGTSGRGVYLQAGYVLSPVWAVSGDTVEFTTNSFRVNGIPHPPRPSMPTEGGFVVPEKHWFVWPEFVTYAGNNVNERNITELLLQMATVSEQQFVGRPFKRWFGRRQSLEPASVEQRSAKARDQSHTSTGAAHSTLVNTGLQPGEPRPEAAPAASMASNEAEFLQEPDAKLCCICNKVLYATRLSAVAPL